MDAPATAQHPVVNILGDRVALGPIHRHHLPLLYRWLNDFEVAYTLSQMRPLTIEFLEESYDRSSKATDRVQFTIYERTTMRPIGGINLHDISGRAATLAIVIGETDCWDKGYGTEATRLVLDYGFNTLGLHNIMLTVHGFNQRGVRAYLRAGFREIGRRREVIHRDGRLHDLIYMDCLAKEFQSPILKPRSSAHAGDPSEGSAKPPKPAADGAAD